MRKTILLIIIIIASAYTGAYLGPEKLNKAGSIAVSESIKCVKVGCNYIKTQWEKPE
jgi:hypothetical protein